MLTARRIYWPPVNLVGPGSVKLVGEEIKKLGTKKALLVSDKVLNKIGVVKQVTDVLDQSGIAYAVFDDVKPNPTTTNVHDGLALYKKENCDFVITVGGGSPQDTGSGIGILATNGGNIADYEGVGKSKNKSVPIVAVSTTAGTAAEVTINYVITDEKRKVKMLMIDPNALPAIAVNDPELMLKKPKDLTAATGLDALTHAIEGYTARGAFELSDAIAFKSIELIGKYLVRAVENGSDLEARSGMSWGSYIAGLCYSNAGLGIVHSMAHQLGGEYDMPHGVANAMLLPYVMEFNMDACPEKFADIARALGVDTSTLTVEEAAEMAVKKVRQLSEKVGIPPLRHSAFQVEDVEKLAEQAMNDACTPANPKDVTKEDIAAIFMKAYNDTPKKG
ncbi:iron-containing alcohol dehydrogenase [Thermoactinomyces mirandus]|uniref:Iron-containing alcohol dehydrogenase n=1 Tax=Thermoactinomyces mirandus TaxID=2756294 RepID=A0A7W1XRM7_9BACL|nr:iron-containing alcohol dehydrogenase [Thermoactinomyces mirandus]MBA4601892.1 iron-containing alcohol dehydrogenase [Thermoactinomyces mirandus]